MITELNEIKILLRMNPGTGLMPLQTAQDPGRQGHLLSPFSTSRSVFPLSSESAVKLPHVHRHPESAPGPRDQSEPV